MYELIYHLEDTEKYFLLLIFFILKIEMIICLAI